MTNSQFHKHLDVLQLEVGGRTLMPDQAGVGV